MTTRQAVMIQPVKPGPLVKLRLRKARNRRRVVQVVADASAMENLKKFNIWAKIWTTAKHDYGPGSSCVDSEATSEGLIKVDDIV